MAYMSRQRKTSGEVSRFVVRVHTPAAQRDCADPSCVCKIQEVVTFSATRFGGVAAARVVAERYVELLREHRAPAPAVYLRNLSQFAGAYSSTPLIVPRRV